ncbi:DUF1572 family protein, partial [Calditrichota bacterium]
RTLSQLSDAHLVWRSGSEANSIAVIVQHTAGSMKSRWTDFLTSDGEKEWRDRDGEFIEPASMTHIDLLSFWEAGWQCLFNSLGLVKPEDLMQEITIRGQTMTALDAIQRQLSHNAYHVGQIVHIAKEQLSNDWQTLSIPKAGSRE